jgi:DNA-directed RNA polymerase specialized sigma24 family protein
MNCKKDDFKRIEKHLENYQNYKIGIQNMKKQLEHYYPKITTSYEPREGSSGSFTFHSSTEDYGLRRIEKREEMEQYIKANSLVLDSIDSAIKLLEPMEREFVREFYFNKKNMKMVAATLGCTLKNAYSLKSEVKKSFLISLQNLKLMDT